MIRRLRNLAAAGFCLLWLLACVGLGWLWWRSHHAEDRAARRVRGTWFALASAHGRLTLLAPPPPAPPSSSPEIDAAIAAFASALRNDRLQWYTVRGATGVDVDPYAAVADRGYVAYRWLDADVNPARPPAVPPPGDRALLDALEEPERFAAAHLILTVRTTTPAASPWRRVPGQPPGGGPRTVDFNGMLVELRPPDRPRRSPMPGYQGRPVPGQLPAVREQWHRRLGVPVASARHGHLMVLMASPPLLAFAAWGRRRRALRRRTRLGRCRQCGYDLRGSPSGRCSECGTRAEKMLTSSN